MRLISGFRAVFAHARARAREPREAREAREDGFSRTRARKPARANRACEISRAEATRQTDGRDRPTSRLAPSSRPDSQERPVSPETLGGETLVQGCAAKQYNPWLRPPKFAAPKALLIRVIHLSGGIPAHGCTQRRKTSGLRSTIRADYDSPAGLRP